MLARLAAQLGHTGEIPLPDISTKEKAQAYIGAPMEKMESEKKQFITQVVPKWVQQGKERQDKMQQYSALRGTSLMEEQYDLDKELLKKEN